MMDQIQKIDENSACGPLLRITCPTLRSESATSILKISFDYGPKNHAAPALELSNGPPIMTVFPSALTLTDVP